MNPLIKILKTITGHRFENRFTWGEAYFKLNPKTWGFTMKLTDRYDDVGDLLVFEIPLVAFYLHIPTRLVKTGANFGDSPSYGLYLYDRLFLPSTLVLCWGKTHHFEMPWNYKHESTEIMTLDSPRLAKTVYKEEKYDYEKREAAAASVSSTWPYLYRLKSGEHQNRIATIHHEKRTCCMRWFPFIKKVDHSIDVKFSDEVGEETGSWKGGCVGCGYTMLKDETAFECLSRMERERRF